MSTAPHATSEQHFEDAALLRPILEPGTGFRVISTLLLLIILGCWMIFGRQVLYGLGGAVVERDLLVQ